MESVKQNFFAKRFVSENDIWKGGGAGLFSTKHVQTLSFENNVTLFTYFRI